MSRNDITLTVDGRIYGGWTSAEITRSIEHIAGTFAVGLTERWPGQQASRGISPGAPVKVAIGGETVITGYVDDVAPEYSGLEHGVTIIGRDATGDLIDCSFVWSDKSESMFMGQTLVQIATAMCKPFGISVRSDVDLPALAIPYMLQLGETVFEAIDRLAKFYGVLPVSDGQGGLVFTRAGAGGSVAGLRLGENILSGGATFTMRNRYSVVYVVGQQASEGNFTVNQALYATATDPGVPRYRPLVLIAELLAADGANPMGARAQWEVNVRAGRARPAMVRVNGWRDANGKLYAPNTMVQVEDDFIGLHDTLLVTSVRLTENEEGEIAQLSVCPRAAFDTIPMPDAIPFGLADRPDRSTPSSTGGK